MNFVIAGHRRDVGSALEELGDHAAPERILSVHRFAIGDDGRALVAHDHVAVEEEQTGTARVDLADHARPDLGVLQPDRVLRREVAGAGGGVGRAFATKASPRLGDTSFGGPGVRPQLPVAFGGTPLEDAVPVRAAGRSGDCTRDVGLALSIVQVGLAIMHKPTRL